MTEQDDNTWYPYAQMGDPDDLDFSSPGPNSGPSFLQQPQTPAPPYPPQAEFFYPDNPVTTQEEYQNLYATPADVLESPTFQEVDFPTPTMAGASFLQSGYDQGAAEPGDLTAQQEAVDPQLDQYRAAYAEWVGISVKQRPVPTAEVLAGYANRTNRSVNSGFIPYFEAAHGIPIGSLSRDVNSKKFEVLTRGAWQPETHTGTSYLSAEQMNALRDIGDPQVKPEQAYAIWQSLPVDQRVPPQGKVLAGWAGKTQVRHCNTGDIEAFESAHGIPTPTLTPLRRGQNRDRHISDLALKEGPGSWDPGTHNTSPLLSPAQVAALKIINAKNGSVEAAYTAWHGLIRMERMRPNSKIVAGFAGKKDHRSINISNLRAFERDENLPENSLEYVRQKEGKIIDVAVAGGKDWHQLYNGRQAPHGFEGFEGVNYSTPAATAGTNFLRDTYTQGGGEWDNSQGSQMMMPQGLDYFGGVNLSTPAATASTSFLQDTYTQGGGEWDNSQGSQMMMPQGLDYFGGVNLSTPAATASTSFLQDTYTQGGGEWDNSQGSQMMMPQGLDYFGGVNLSTPAATASTSFLQDTYTQGGGEWDNSQGSQMMMPQGLDYSEMYFGGGEGNVEGVSMSMESMSLLSSGNQYLDGPATRGDERYGYESASRPAAAAHWRPSGSRDKGKGRA